MRTPVGNSGRRVGPAGDQTAAAVVVPARWAAGCTQAPGTAAAPAFGRVAVAVPSDSAAPEPTWACGTPESAHPGHSRRRSATAEPGAAPEPVARAPVPPAWERV